MQTNIIYNEDCRKTISNLENESVNCIVTSPPYYGVRDYGVENQIGLESSPQEYVTNLVSIFESCKKILTKDCTVWVNIGDSYYNYRPGKFVDGVANTLAKGDKRDLPSFSPKRKNKLVGFKEKDLLGIPWRFAFAMQENGWYLRQDIIWSKNNCYPESVKDRFTKSHEYIFLFTINKNYYFDVNAVLEDTAKGEKRRRRSVWNMNTSNKKSKHKAMFPLELPTLCIKAGCPEQGIVYDPFMGAGTTALACKNTNRLYIGSELNGNYII